MTDIVATFEDGKKPRILARWDYTPDFRNVITNLKSNTQGARFRPRDKVWTMPATVDNCHGLRAAFGDDLKIKKPLAQWYIANKGERDSQEAFSHAKDAELRFLPLTAPLLAETLRPDQRVGVRWIADGYRGSGLLADKPGLGKTLELIGGVLEADLQGPILIICPKVSVRSVWFHELRRWAPDESVHIARGTRAQREKALAEFHADPADRKWLIIVAEMLRVKRKENDTGVKANAKRRGRIEGYEYPELFLAPWAAIICDESHRLLGSLTVAKSNLMGEGLMKLPQNEDGRRYAGSGTPFGRGGRIQGMFGTLHWLWPDEYTSFWRWAENHFEIEESDIGRGRTAKKIIGLRKGTEAEAFLHSLGPRILRRTKEEVLKDLPSKQYVEVLCEMSPKQKRQYKSLGDDAEIVLPNGNTLMANGVLAEITRAKQIANGEIDVNENGETVFTGESCKIDALMEKLDSRPDTKVIVSSRFNAFLNGCVIPALEAAGIEYHVLTGATKDADRERAMGEFQGEGGPRVFVLNSKAGGVSINLDAADEVHCMDELDNPEDNEQLEDRAHRASRIHQVTIFYYRTEGTYDVNIANSVEDKRQAQFEVLDGRRGIQDVRNWIKYQED